MKKRKILIVCFLALLIIFPFVFSGCSSKSNMIYCDDFTTTYRVNLMLDVKNRTRFAPTDGKQAFCYKGDLQTLCDDINDRNNMQFVIVNDRIVIDVKKLPLSLTFSFVIYKENDERVKVPKNYTRYVIDSMGCRLKSGETSKEVFFPEHLLSSMIDSSKDIADVTYMCSLTIEELKEYYKQRGYKTEISDNVLSVTSLKTYPEKNSSDKTLGVKIKYLNEKELQFVGFIEEYDF